MFIYYIIFVYGSGQNSVPHTFRYLLNKQYLLNDRALFAGALMAGALLTARYGERLLYN